MNSRSAAVLVVVAVALDTVTVLPVALDTVMPHPMYGRMHWICVLTPSEATFETVKTHLANIYTKLGIHNRAQATAFQLTGLTEGPPRESA